MDDDAYAPSAELPPATADCRDMFEQLASQSGQVVGCPVCLLCMPCLLCLLCPRPCAHLAAPCGCPPVLKPRKSHIKHTSCTLLLLLLAPPVPPARPPTLPRRQLARVHKKATLTSREVQTAVRLVLPGELAKHAVSEGTKVGGCPSPSSL